MASRRRKAERDPPQRNSSKHYQPSWKSSSSLKVPLLTGILILSVICYTALRRLLYLEAPLDHITDVEQAILTRDASIFSIQDLPGKGKGVVALRDIKQGELIIRERPLFILPYQVTSSPTALISYHLQQLTPYQYSQFYNLSYVKFPSNLDPKHDLLELALTIFQTNAVAAGEGVGIFPRMARLNHGCSSAFNVVYNWREKEGMLTVYALKDIKKGQELLTTYGDTKRPRDQRRSHLQHQYDFHCACDVCTLPDKESLESDQRLVAMSELQARFETWGAGAIHGSEAISLVKQIWDLGTKEGYTSERGRLASDAVWVAAAHADAASTKAWARLAEEWFGYEVGLDSEQVQEMRTLQFHPESHPAWGSRQKIHIPGPNS